MPLLEALCPEPTGDRSRAEHTRDGTEAIHYWPGPGHRREISPCSHRQTSLPDPRHPPRAKRNERRTNCPCRDSRSRMRHRPRAPAGKAVTTPCARSVRHRAVRPGDRRLVAPAHDAVGADDHQRTLGEAAVVQHAEGAAVAPLGSKSESCAIVTPSFSLNAACDQRRVAGDRVERRAALGELVEHLFVERQLVVADGAERERVEDEDARVPEQVRARELLAVARSSSANSGTGVPAASTSRSTAQAELLDQLAVALEIGAPQVVEEAAAAADEHQQAAARVVVLLCSRRCSVRSLIRSVSCAIWTLVLPVSLLVGAVLGGELALAFAGQCHRRLRTVADRAGSSAAAATIWRVARRPGASARPAPRRSRSGARRAAARGSAARSSLP